MRLKEEQRCRPLTRAPLREACATWTKRPRDRRRWIETRRDAPVKTGPLLACAEQTLPEKRTVSPASGVPSLTRRLTRSLASATGAAAAATSTHVDATSDRGRRPARNPCFSRPADKGMDSRSYVESAKSARNRRCGG